VHPFPAASLAEDNEKFLSLDVNKPLVARQFTCLERIFGGEPKICSLAKERCFLEGHRRPSHPASQLAATETHPPVKKTTAVGMNSKW
jgi:hypothetical protein